MLRSRCLTPGCDQLTAPSSNRCPNHTIQHRRARQQRPPSSQRGHGHAYRQARAALLANNPPCTYCGNPATTADYAIPWSRGGTLDDLVPACLPCNLKKGNRPR